MQRAVKSIPIILLACVFCSWIFLLCSCTLFDDNIFGTYNLDYIEWKGRKVKSGKSGVPEDYFVLTFREDGSFTISDKMFVGEEVTGTWVQSDNKKYELVFDNVTESDEPIVWVAVFNYKKCKILFEEDEVVYGLKYYSAET